MLSYREGDGEGLHNDEISKEFREIMLENEILAKENRLYHAYLHRNLGAVREEDVDSIQLQVPPGHTIGESIPPSLRYSMALQEHEFRVKQLNELNNKVSEDINLLKAIIESIRVRTSELRKDSYEFQREVVVRGENERTGTIMSETLLDYWEQKVREKRLTGEKLLRKAAALAEQRAKLEAQVRVKESQGDHLLSIDFHQLQIKNQQYNLKIKELNNELFGVKSTTVRTVQILNAKKRELAELIESSTQLKKDIVDKHNSISRLKADLEGVEEEVKAERAKNRKFRMQQSNPDIPHVIDYVRQKSEVYELEAEARNWARKVDIATLAAARTTTLRSKTKQQRAAHMTALRHALRAGGSLSHM